MTIKEFSEQWDIMYNNIASNSAPGLDEYEKSVFLTEAQKEVVLALYNGTLGYGFEGTEANRKYLAPLVRTVVLTQNNSIDIRRIPDYDGKKYFGLADPVYTSSYFYRLPEDLWFITYENVAIKDKNGCLANRPFDVVPVTQDMFAKTQNNPFRGANDRKVLRLDVEPVKMQTVSGDNNFTPDVVNAVELVSKYDIDEYLIRYIRYPRPIILEKIDPNTAAIDGERVPRTSELSPIIHKVILETAIRKAYAIRPQ